MLTGLLTLTILAQAPAAAATTPPAEELSVSERAAQAAERAALAAERAAQAAERLAASAASSAPAAPASPAAKPADGWAGTIGVGFAFITGNAQTLTLTGNVSAERKFGDWLFGLRANGAYGLANPTANVQGSTAVTTARRAAGTLRGDRSFGLASIFILGGSEFDHVKNIESRTVGELGTGLTFFDRKEGDLEKLFFRVDIAARVGYETRFQYFPTPAAISPYDIIILAPRAALTFRWAPNADVRITEELELIPFVLAPDAGRLLINSLTKLSAKVAERVSLTAAVLVNFDSLPPQVADPAAAQRLPTDVALTIGVEAAL